MKNVPVACNGGIESDSVGRAPKGWTCAALSFVLGFGFLSAACGSAPTAEITTAKTAIASIETGEVRNYAPESLKAAEEELNKALGELQAQEAKFVMSRDYTRALRLLKSAKSLADKAKADAETGKTKSRSDAEATLAALPQLIQDARQALAKAPKGKDTKADLEAMQADLKLAEEALTEAGTAMSQGKYAEVLSKANSAKTKAAAVVEQINKAQAKVKARR